MRNGLHIWERERERLCFLLGWAWQCEKVWEKSMRVFWRWESNKGGGKKVGISHHLLSGIEWRIATKPSIQLKWDPHTLTPVCGWLAQFSSDQSTLHDRRNMWFVTCMNNVQIVGPNVDGDCSQNDADEPINSSFLFFITEGVCSSERTNPYGLKRSRINLLWPYCVVQF